MNILLVDDTGYIRIILKHVLTAIGFEVVGEASDGQEAVRMYRSLSPDLVIMDITMPQMNGLEAVKSIIGYNPDAKIIMCSAMAQRNSVVSCIKAGAKDFIAKPFEINTVIEVIQRVMEIPIDSKM
ncbi:response regulator [Paenibacillus sp. HJGM_3]|uniref:response regulator n=1 Tax=Paenibacillus sp. HJGM_3 TaxID=3379816 RepID=UPI003857F733